MAGYESGVSLCWKGGPITPTPLQLKGKKKQPYLCIIVRRGGGGRGWVAGRHEGLGHRGGASVYCQDGEMLLLLSRSSAAGHVQARYTSSRLRPSAHVRTGDRKKAIGPYVSRRK